MKRSRNTIRAVSQFAERIRDWVMYGESGAVKERLLKREKAFLPVCVSMDYLEDSLEAIGFYLRYGLGSNKTKPGSYSPINSHGGKYLKLYGTLQALVLNQDAISDLHLHLLGHKPQISKASTWYKVRRLRVCVAGHPQDPESEGPAFVSRPEIGSRSFRYHYYFKHKQIVSDLIQLDHEMIGYLREAETTLSKMVASLGA